MQMRIIIIHTPILLIQLIPRIHHRNQPLHQLQSVITGLEIYAHLLLTLLRAGGDVGVPDFCQHTVDEGYLVVEGLFEFGYVLLLGTFDLHIFEFGFCYIIYLFSQLEVVLVEEWRE